MIVRAPRRGFAGLGAVSYPTTGQAQTPAEFQAGYFAVATPVELTFDPTNPSSWSARVAINTSLKAQSAYMRSLYDSAIASPGDGHGNYLEPAYPAYVYSANVPTWAQPYLQAQVAEPAPGDTPQSVAQIMENLAAASAPVSSPPAAGNPVSSSPESPAAPGAPGDRRSDNTDSGAVSGLASIPVWAWAVGAGVVVLLVLGGSDGH